LIFINGINNFILQVERKRHIGNDVVVIIFKDGKQPFDPLILTNQFNRILIQTYNMDIWNTNRTVAMNIFPWPIINRYFCHCWEGPWCLSNKVQV